MSIKIGDRLPDGVFKVIGGDGPVEMKASDIFNGKTVVLFGVPGAFTPTCHMNHLPGFVEHFDAFKAKGVDTIAVVSVNDMFVMDAWKKATSAGDKILFLADGSASYVKDLGLELDASGFGMGIRSKRFALIAKDGVVTALNVEDAPGLATVSGAAAMLEAL